MQTYSKDWMRMLEQDILDLINDWDISVEEGLKYANKPKYLKDNIKL